MITNVQIVGIIVTLILICFSVISMMYFTSKLNAQEKLLCLLVFIITLLCTTWVADNVISINKRLLTEDANKTILQIMSSVVSLGLGYVLRGYVDKKQSE